MAIIGALPNIISDGQVIDAVPVMADFNFIVAQVNANAQPLATGGVTAEWAALGQTPTYISATSYSVPGNLTGTLLPDLRQWSINTGGNIYSSILTSTFGGGITTVTVANDSGVLDTGLSAINISIQNPVNLSQPARSAVVVSQANGVTLTSASTFIIGENFTPALNVDLLSEFSTGTGTFTAKQKGVYRIFTQFGINWSGAGTPTVLGTLQLFVNGSSYAQTPIAVPATFGGVSAQMYYLETIVSLAIAGTLQMKINTPTVVGAPATYANPVTTPVLMIQRVA